MSFEARASCLSLLNCLRWEISPRTEVKPWLLLNSAGGVQHPSCERWVSVPLQPQVQVNAPLAHLFTLNTKGRLLTWQAGGYAAHMDVLRPSWLHWPAGRWERSERVRASESRKPTPAMKNSDHSCVELKLTFGAQLVNECEDSVDRTELKRSW